MKQEKRLLSHREWEPARTTPYLNPTPFFGAGSPFLQHPLLTPERTAQEINFLRPREEFGSGAGRTRVERHYDPHSQTVDELFIVGSDRGQRSYRLHYRLYSREELTYLLTQAGFDPVVAFSGYSPEPINPNSPTMLMVGRKPAQ